jgi:hypothetical protein
LAALLRKEDEPELRRLYRRSVELGAGRSGAQALLLCAILLGLPLSDGFRQELMADAGTRLMVAVAIDALGKGGGETELDDLLLGTAAIHLSHFLMVKGARYKRSEFRRKFLQPDEEAAGGSPVAGFLLPLHSLRSWLKKRSDRSRRRAAQLRLEGDRK